MISYSSRSTVAGLQCNGMVVFDKVSVWNVLWNKLFLSLRIAHASVKMTKPLQIAGYLVGEGEPELKGLSGFERN